MKKDLIRRKCIIALVFFNFVMFFILAGILIYYFSNNQETLKRKNLDDVVHLTDSSSNIVMSYVKCHREKLIEIRKYAEEMNMTLSELNEYINSSTYKNIGEYKLIDEGGNIVFSTGDDLWNDEIIANDNIQKALNEKDVIMPLEVCYIPEFVILATGEKVIGVYTRFRIRGDSGESITCILANIFTTDRINSLLDFQKNYPNLNFSLIDDQGRYMVNCDETGGDKFFLRLMDMGFFNLYNKELYNNNGRFFYTDDEGYRAVLSYSRIIGTDWFVVSRLRLENIAEGIAGLSITLFVTTMLICLIIIDIAYMYNINEKLICSMENTRLLTFARSHDTNMKDDDEPVIIRHEPDKEILDKFFDVRAYVIDNEFSSCDNVSKMFESMGIYCEWGMTGKESLSRIKDCENDKPFNMFFVQWELTDMRVHELISRLRNIKGQDVTIIILTDEENEAVKKYIEEERISAFATKPLFMSDLKRLLYKLV